MKQGIKNKIWPIKKLGEVCDILDSKRRPVTKKNRKLGPYPYYGATGVQDYVADYIFDEPLVLVGEDGAKWGTGEQTAYRVDGKYWVNNHAHVLRPHRDILIDGWLVYFLNISDLSECITGLTVKKLNQEKLRNIKISLPPISEQKRIVEKIEKFFAKIDEASRLRVESSSASAALLPSALHQVFSRSKKEGWEEKELNEVAETKMGGTPRTTYREFWEGGNIAWITPEDMEKNIINFLTDSRRKITRVGLKKSNAKLFSKDTVLISTTATIGKIGIAGKELSANQQVTGVICGQNLEPKFLAYYFLYLGEDKLKKIGGQAVATHINQTNFRKLKIPLPSIAEQKKIVAYLDAFSTKTRELQNLQTQTATDFSALRQSVLSKAFKQL